MHPQLEWDLPRPFVIDVTVTPDRVDDYGHVSTNHFIEYLTDCAFAHSAAVGLPAATCMKMERGMVVRDIRVSLLGPAYAGDKLQVANWISKVDAKLRASRQFQIINIESAKTLLRGEIDFICTNLKNGRPTRMPKLFVERYVLPE